MTPNDLDDALQSAALTFVREVKQQDVPLRVNRELAVDIIRTTRYQHRDEISLILEARAYIKGRLPVRDRATAGAILLQRDAVLIADSYYSRHDPKPGKCDLGEGRYPSPTGHQRTGCSISRLSLTISPDPS